MKFLVVISTVDGNQEKEFSTWEDAHLYANEWMDGFTHWNHRHFNNVEIDKYVNCWQTRKGETVRIEKIKNSDEKHYGEMNEFFNEQAENLIFAPYLPFCSACGEEKPHYVGFIPNAAKRMVSFAFCVNCRDQFTLKKNAIEASKERIGA